MLLDIFYNFRQFGQFLYRKNRIEIDLKSKALLLTGNLFAIKRVGLLLFNLFLSLTFSHNPALQCDCQTISHLYDIRSNIERYDYLESQCDTNKGFPENVFEVLHHCKIKKILLSTLIPCLGK